MTTRMRGLQAIEMLLNFDSQTIAYGATPVNLERFCYLTLSRRRRSTARKIGVGTNRVGLRLRVAGNDAVIHEPAYRLLHCGKRCMAGFVT